jgi:hypothetical protein
MFLLLSALVCTAHADDPTPYDHPDAFIAGVEATVAASQVDANAFYVAISCPSYCSQLEDETGVDYDCEACTDVPCPWPTLLECPYGDDDRTHADSDVMAPFATFRHALAEMRAHELSLTEGEDSAYRLDIRGGDFVYEQALVIAPNKTWDTVTYDSPRAAEDDGQAGDVSVGNYGDERVVIEGGCDFVDRGGDALERCCDAEMWGLEEVDGCAVEPVDEQPAYAFFSSRGMVEVFDGKRVEIEGLAVQNSPLNHIRIQHQSDYVWVHDMDTRRSYGSGVIVYGSSHIMVSDSNIDESCAGSEQEQVSVRDDATYVGLVNNVIGDGYDDASFGIGGGTNHLLIRGNEIFGSDSMGVYLDGAWDGIHHIRVDNNWIHDLSAQCVTVGAENCGVVSDIRVANNLCVDNHQGLWLTDNSGRDPLCSDDSDHGPFRVSFSNNTVLGSEAYGIRLESGQTCEISVTNNIFSENGTKQIWLEDAGNTDCPDWLSMESNLTWCDMTDDPGCLVGEEGSIVADPRLGDPARRDYHPAFGSPVINQGTHPAGAFVPAFDAEGRWRRLNDLGALEARH